MEEVNKYLKDELEQLNNLIEYTFYSQSEYAEGNECYYDVYYICFNLEDYEKYELFNNIDVNDYNYEILLNKIILIKLSKINSNIDLKNQFIKIIEKIKNINKFNKLQKDLKVNEEIKNKVKI